MTRPARRWFSAEVLALGGYVLLALIFTYPLSLHLGTLVVGRHGDVEEYLWSFWWTRKATLELHTNPFFTRWLYYPNGVSLYFFAFNPLHAFLSIPLQELLGLQMAYNLISLLTFVAAAFAMNRLAYDITGDQTAAFVAGLVFGFAPTQVFHFNVGQPNLYAVEFIPVAILCVRRWLIPRPPTNDDRQPTTEDRGLKIENSNVDASEKRSSILHPPSSIRWLLGGAIALALSSLADWQFAVYLQLFIGLVLVAELLAARGEWRAALGRLFWRFLALEVLYALAVAPVIIPMLRELGGPEPYMVRSRADTIYHSSDLLAFFIPNPAHPLWRDWAQQQIDRLNTDGVLVTVVSVSFVALALALVGAVRRWAQARFWVLCGLLFWVLAMGPRLRIGGRVTEVPLPYELLFLVKAIQVSRTPGRYFIIALVCLAVLAALGIQTLRQNRRPTTDDRRPTTEGAEDRGWKIEDGSLDASEKRSSILHPLSSKEVGGQWSVVVVVAVVVALCFELLPAPVLAEPPAPTPAFYTDGTLRDAGAIMELPNPANLGMYYATQHGRPVLYGELSRDNPPGPLLDYLRNGLFRDEIVDMPANWGCTVGFFNITHLVSYRYGQPDAGATEAQIAERLGPAALLRDTPEAVLYRLPPATPGQTCVVIGDGWGTARPFGAGRPLYRWAGQRATLGLLRHAPGRVTLHFTAHSFVSARQLKITRDGQVLGQLTIGVDSQPQAIELDLPTGVTWLELRGVEPAQSPADFGYPESDPVTIGFSQVMVEEQ